MNVRSLLACLSIAAALLVAAPGNLQADHHEEISNPDAKCLKCHTKNLKKKLEDGERMSLKVDASAFEASVHSVIGCTGCHRDTLKGKHPSREPVSSQRDYSIARNESCGQCHSAKMHDYGDGIHASLVAAGNPVAPVCSDCHSAHAVQPVTAEASLAGTACKSCHDDIHGAYAQSVHGVARAEGNTIRPDHFEAPACADCHSAHQIDAVAAIDHLQATCLSCHEGASQAHAEWLPNSSMHMSSVSCAACHSPLADRRVDLQLYDRVDQAPVGLSENHGAVKDRLTDMESSGESLDSVELWKLMRRTSEDGSARDVALRGRLEVTSGVDAHRLAPRGEALRDCETCHQGNAEAFRNVTVSVSGPDGRKQRFPAESEVLNSPVSVDAVGDFYAPGATRIKLLDGMLVLAIFGALAIPAGHITLGKLIRRKK